MHLIRSSISKTYQIWSLNDFDDKVKNVQLLLNNFELDPSIVYKNKHRAIENGDILSIEEIVNNTTKTVSPVLVLNYFDQLFLLDGNHRCVAASIIGSPIQFLEVRYDLRPSHSV